MKQEVNLGNYKSYIGRSRHDLITPALILDLDIARENIANMAKYMRNVPAKLRPHIKVHKSPELGRMQMEAGEALGLTTATVWEAVVMVRGGIDDILVANEVVGEEKIRTLSTLREKLTSLLLEPEADQRVLKARAAMDKLIESVDFLTHAGFASEIISGGGTGTYNITGVNPRVTELQAGSYVVMDAFHAQLVPGFPVALTVLGTVISRQGKRVVLDSGRKAIGSELGLPRLMDVPATTEGIAEEHLLVEVESGSLVKVGDRLEVVS